MRKAFGDGIVFNRLVIEPLRSVVYHWVFGGGCTGYWIFYMDGYKNVRNDSWFDSLVDRGDRGRSTIHIKSEKQERGGFERVDGDHVVLLRLHENPIFRGGSN